jgi:hypothetical protein
VELLDVEPVAKRPFRFIARANPRHVADLVAARLADADAIALDFTLRARAGEACRLDHVIGRLLAGPALGVEACVHHQARRAEEE